MKPSLLLTAILLSASPGVAGGRTLQEAATAYGEGRVREAEAILAHILSSPSSSAAERARALRTRARIAFRIDGDLPRALADIASAEATGAEACETAVAKARLLQEGDRDQQLLTEAPILAGRCADAHEAGSVRFAAAAAALDLAAAQGTPPQAVQRARAFIDELGSEERSSAQGSVLRLQAALLAGDAPEALQAWRDYFWLADGDVPQGVRAPTGGVASLLQRALPGNAPLEAQLQLVDLLVRAGFAESAERFALNRALSRRAEGQPLWLRARAYFEARRDLQEAIRAVNRRLARGEQVESLQATYDAALARLAAASGLAPGPEAVRDAFGLYGIVGRTGGFPSIHLGHVVQYEQLGVEQYGHRAQVAFITLDNMVSNGFQSWLWDGAAQTGGWTAAGPVIVQIRSGYSEGPLENWRIATGGRSRERILARQPERAAADLATAASGRAGALPGLADRLRLQVADQILSRVRRPGIAPADLRRAFLDEFRRASFQHSILLHEGRHAIDRSLVTGLAATDNSLLEYRAKLSELALADYPRLALYSMVVADVGNASSHGAANARIIDGLVAWAQSNTSRIANFDPRQSAMVQLDRLSDDQIRNAARGLDPLARPTS